MNERIRLLREYKGLSRAAFGNTLGVSGDVINNLERGRVEIKDYMVKLICSEYSVNENWLRNGIEPMYVQSNMFSLDDFMNQHNATELELDIVKAYFELETETRKMLLQHFKERLLPNSYKKDTKNKNSQSKILEIKRVPARGSKDDYFDIEMTQEIKKGFEEDLNYDDSDK